MKTNTLLSHTDTAAWYSAIYHMHNMPHTLLNPVLFSLQWNSFITIMGLQNCVGEGCTLSGVPLQTFKGSRYAPIPVVSGKLLKGKTNQHKAHCGHKVSRLEELFGSEQPTHNYIYRFSCVQMHDSFY